MPEVLSTLEYDFASELNGNTLRVTGLGARGEVLALSVSSVKPGARRSYQIHEAVGGQIRSVALAPGGGDFHIIQPWGENQFLLVHARGDGENAFVIDADGFCVRKMAFGDAIEDVQVAANGQIWVSYFDEAFGNVSGDGLRCLNAASAVLFDWNQGVWHSKSLRAGTILDCYMLNVVSDHDVWLCPYTDFPLHHLRDFQLKQSFAVPEEMIGSSSFAIWQARLIFAGGYHFRERIFWHDLQLAKTVELQLFTPDCEPLRFDRVQSRGAQMWLWSGTKVFRVGVDEVWPAD